MTQVRVQVSGKVHSGKTAVFAEIVETLSKLGVKVTYQKVDPQLKEKLDNPEQRRKRLETVDEVFVTEIETGV